MQGRNARTAEQVRRDIEAERQQLAHAVQDLRAGVKAATDVRAKLRSRLPVIAAGALGAGFFLGGGIRATRRLLSRRNR